MLTNSFTLETDVMNLPLRTQFRIHNEWTYSLLLANMAFVPRELSARQAAELAEWRALATGAFVSSSSLT